MTDEYELHGPWTGEALCEKIPPPAKPRYRERLITPLGWAVLSFAFALLSYDALVAWWG